MRRFKIIAPWVAHLSALALLSFVLLAVPAKVRALGGVCPVTPSGGYDGGGGSVCPQAGSLWESE